MNNPAAIQNHWGDTPVSYHNGAGCISFADGYSEIHKWRGTAIQPPVNCNSNLSQTFFDPTALDFADYQWLAVERSDVRY